MNKRLLRRIEKLLNLSKNNPSEEEAASASHKVRELFNKHNLSLSDIVLENTKIGELRFADTQNISDWAFELACVICKFYSCMAFKNVENRKSSLLFIGRKSDITVALYNFEVLYRIIKSKTFKGKGRRFCANWRLGFVKGLRVKMQPVNDEGLVTTSKWAIREYLAKATITKATTPVITDRKGYSLGYEEGLTSNTHKAVHGNTRSLTAK